MKKASVLVSIVTWNEERFLERCLESVVSQTCPVEVKLFDNASEDRTVEIAKEFDVSIHESGRNLGYSFGHNHILNSSRFDCALLLNADVVLRRDFVERLVNVAESYDRVGAVGGKLLRMDEDGSVVRREGAPLIDSTGIYFTPSQRHFDRGSNVCDRGQFEQRQLVFGITGAAVLLKRELLEDVRFEDQYLDEDFFAYREDADLAWRSQLLGWRSVYEPKAVGLHFRRVLPQNRSAVSRAVNFHSVKNRYLMRAKNIDWAVRFRCFPQMWLRDACIFAYILLKEYSSLGALREVVRLRGRTREKRLAIQSRRTVAPASIAKWFSNSPRSVDL